MIRNILATILLLAVCVTHCSKDENKKLVQEERFTIGRVDLKDVILQTGEVQPIVKVELKSEASGKIEKVYVKEGQRVAKGDKILEIDPFRLLTRKKRVDLALKKAQIRRQLAERDYQHALRLSETGTVSEKKLEDVKSQLDLRTIEYKEGLLEQQDIEDQLRKTVIVAPMNGVVTKLEVEEGEIAVSATSGFQGGTAIGTIADISKLEVITTIGEVDYIKIKKGQGVIIRPEALENTWTFGKIDFISLSAKKAKQEELGSFEVRVALDSIIPGIVPGINVNVEFVVLEKKNVLGVPYHCVRKRGEKTIVHKVVTDKSGEEKARPQPVKLGATDYNHYEVYRGLKEGDVVVFKPKPKDGKFQRRR